jgi:hypothetical protein
MMGAGHWLPGILATALAGAKAGQYTQASVVVNLVFAYSLVLLAALVMTEFD